MPSSPSPEHNCDLWSSWELQLEGHSGENRRKEGKARSWAPTQQGPGHPCTHGGSALRHVTHAHLQRPRNASGSPHVLLTQMKINKNEEAWVRSCRSLQTTRTRPPGDPTRVVTLLPLRERRDISTGWAPRMKCSGITVEAAAPHCECTKCH